MIQTDLTNLNFDNQDYGLYDKDLKFEMFTESNSKQLLTTDQILTPNSKKIDSLQKQFKNK